eukprot:1148707-Pelagomonas_calceolata.AAC.1
MACLSTMSTHVKVSVPDSGFMMVRDAVATQIRNGVSGRYEHSCKSLCAGLRLHDGAWCCGSSNQKRHHFRARCLGCIRIAGTLTHDGTVAAQSSWAPVAVGVSVPADDVGGAAQAYLLLEIRIGDRCLGCKCITGILFHDGAVMRVDVGNSWISIMALHMIRSLEFQTSAFMPLGCYECGSQGIFESTFMTEGWHGDAKGKVNWMSSYNQQPALRPQGIHLSAPACQ